MSKATTHMKKHNAFLLTAGPLMIFSLLTENMEKKTIRRQKWKNLWYNNKSKQMLKQFPAVFKANSVTTKYRPQQYRISSRSITFKEAVSRDFRPLFFS